MAHVSCPYRFNVVAFAWCRCGRVKRDDFDALCARCQQTADPCAVSCKRCNPELELDISDEDTIEGGIILEIDGELEIGNGLATPIHSMKLDAALAAS